MQWGDGIPRDGTSRKMREYQIRFCEKRSVKFTGLTRQFPRSTRCRISKIGDEGVRTALYEAGHIILTRPLKGCTALKSWAMRLAKRAGMKKAKVALARKLAVIMHRMLVDGTLFKSAAVAA